MVEEAGGTIFVQDFKTNISPLSRVTYYDKLYIRLIEFWNIGKDQQ